MNNNFEIDHKLLKRKDDCDRLLSRLDKRLKEDDGIEYILDKFNELLDICTESIEVSEELHDKYNYDIAEIDNGLAEVRCKTPIAAYCNKNLYKFKEPIKHPTLAGLEHLGYDIDEKLYYYECVDKDLLSVFLLEMGEELK